MKALIENTILEANSDYHTDGTSLLSDAEYDQLVEELRKLDPNSPVLSQVGAPLADTKQKVALPYPMRSLDKLKPGDDIARWLKGCSSIAVTPKFDGVSLLVTYRNGAVAAYTRGDGETGGNVTHLLPFLKLPALPQSLAVRGEVIMSLKAFHARWSTQFANPRNLVAGLVNSLDVKPGMADLHFIAYELVDAESGLPHAAIASPSEGLAELSKLGFRTAPVQVVDADLLDDERLAQMLRLRKDSSMYELDGLVLAYEQRNDREAAGNPSYMRAFKVNSEGVAVRVVDVQWNVSKDGLLKPRVQIEPVNLGGVTVTWCTGFNAAYIRDQRIGPGAVLRIVRSGEVIPHIQEVLVPADQPALPDTHEAVWEGVDLLVVDAHELDAVIQRRQLHFATTLGMTGWGDAITGKMVEAGYRDVRDVVTISAQELAALPGMGAQSAANLVQARQTALQDVRLASLMDASGVFGRLLGTSRCESILQRFPDLEAAFGDSSDDLIRQQLCTVDGIADATAMQFAHRLSSWLSFFASIQQHVTIKQARPRTGPMKEELVCVSGFRDVALGERIAALGGTLTDSFTKKVTILIVKDMHSTSSKVEQARKMAIKIMSRADIKNLLETLE